MFDKAGVGGKQNESVRNDLVMKQTNKKNMMSHQMETFSALLAICAVNSPIAGEFPAQRPVTRSFDVFVDLLVNKRLSKQSWGWWFETPRAHYDVTLMSNLHGFLTCGSPECFIMSANPYAYNSTSTYMGKCKMLSHVKIVSETTICTFADIYFYLKCIGTPQDTTDWMR